MRAGIVSLELVARSAAGFWSEAGKSFMPRLCLLPAFALVHLPVLYLAFFTAVEHLLASGAAVFGLYAALRADKLALGAV